MKQKVKIQEFVMVLATQGQSPSVLNAEFLRFSNIVPEDWQLARKPVYTEQFIQIAYENGVAITAQPSRIILSELLQDRTVDETSVPSIAQKLVTALPKLNYQGVGINPRGYLTVEAGQDAASQYVANHLLAEGPWQRFGEAPVRASVNYVYQLEHGRLNLSVSEATLQLPEQETAAVILFSGNIDHSLEGDEPSEKVSQLDQVIANWKRDVASYTMLVDTCFTIPQNEVSPASEPALV